ncbi:MAG: ATP-binding protein [Acidimicrobiia bacterium]|nr:ATP-binding protein [Acidimicrobiia bacterium]NNL27322.1 ATP-binding protein [Acidimicrobiia bacterium]
MDSEDAFTNDHGDGTSIVDVRVPRGRTGSRFARRLVREYCRTHRIPAHIAADVELMTSELITNVVSHAYGPATLTIKRLDTATYRVEVRSKGDRFAWRPPGKDRKRSLTQGSWGLTILDQLADRWDIGDEDGFTTVSFEFLNPEACHTTNSGCQLVNG